MTLVIQPSLSSYAVRFQYLVNIICFIGADFETDSSTVMGFGVVNRTDFNLTVCLCLGGTHYFENDIKPKEIFYRAPLTPFYTIVVYPTELGERMTTGRAATQIVRSVAIGAGVGVAAVGGAVLVVVTGGAGAVGILAGAEGVAAASAVGGGAALAGGTAAVGGTATAGIAGGLAAAAAIKMIEKTNI